MNRLQKKRSLAAGAHVAGALAMGNLTAAAADVFYQYFCFTPTFLRGSGENSIQVSEFQFIDNGSPIDVAGVIVTGLGGDSPGGEGPTNLIDLSTGSKWLGFNKFTPMVFEFSAPVTAQKQFAICSNY